MEFENGKIVFFIVYKIPMPVGVHKFENQIKDLLKLLIKEY